MQICEARFPSRGSEPYLTLHDLLLAGARRIPDSPAILGLGRPPLTYGGLYHHVAGTSLELNRLGVKRNDRVAIVLPNGPEMAVAFLAVTACAACAPLNPQYRAEEFHFYLSDLNARALIAGAGSGSVAVGVAAELGLPVIELSSIPSEAAGVFALAGFECASSALPQFARPDDVALVLHTSGTTSRPKMVPLTQTNLVVSAGNVAASLALTQADRCLNVMPLFHIHGLVAAVLASLWAGGSVVCLPGFNAPRFFEWLDRNRPTWFTAVPTMHQAILARAEQNAPVIERRPLRLIRSSSASLAPRVMVELERVFQTPVIEAYGMTEAAHQMTSNPLPPRERKPGTVGVASGPEVAIMDEHGNLLPPGQPGEVVIRGPNVTRGYENNPEANASAFTNGWFRTGDQGSIDRDGYLSLTGRLKEIINRGGEKISPREVDEVLLDHPAVAQAVTFAVPDPRLGEKVGAAIVLRPGRTTTEQAIREFVASRLADFKVPGTVVFLDEIPKGPTGKQQRIGLAAKLGIQGSAPPTPRPAKPYAPPRTAVEATLAEIWAEVLNVKRVGADDDFLQLGGDSVLGAQVVSRIRDRLGQELTLASFFQGATLNAQAALLEKMLSGRSS